MSSDTTLKLGVDTSDVEKGSEELNKLSESAKKAEKFAQSMADAYKKAGAGQGDAAKKMAQEAKEAEKNFAAMSAMAVKAGGIIGTAIATSFIAFAANVARTVQEIDTLAKSAQAFGTTVERMSALEDATKRTGNSFSQSTAMVQQFMRTLRQVNAESEQGRVIKAIGLDINTLKNQDIIVSLQQVAAAFDKIPESSNKAIAFQRLFNRSIIDGGEILREFAKDSRLVGTVTGEQAEQAVKLKSAVDGLKFSLSQFARDLATDTFPALTKFVDMLNAAREASGSLAGAAANNFRLVKIMGAGFAFAGQGADALFQVQEKLAEAERVSAEQEKNPLRRFWRTYSKEDIDTLREAERYLKSINKVNDEGGPARGAAARTLTGHMPRVESAEERAQRLQLENARFSSSTNSIQRQMQTESEAFARAQSVMDGLRQRGEISDRKYYEDKRARAEASSLKVVKGLEAERDALMARQGTIAEVIGYQDQAAAKDREIARVRADTAKVVADTYAEEELAIKQVGIAMEFALRSDKEAFDAAMARQELMLSLVGSRPKIADRAVGEFAVREQYDSQIRAIELQRDQAAANRELTDQEARGYAQRIAELARFREASIEAYNTIKNAQEAALRDPLVGIGNAMQDYIDAVENAAVTTEQLFTRAFKGAEDALVDFVMTGKLNFKGFVQSIIADLVRLQIQTMMASSMKGGWMGAIFSAITGKAAGGAVSAGGAYVVGEDGPEMLLMGSQSGTIIPNGATVGSGVSVSMPMHVSIDARSDQAQVFQIVQASIAEGQRAMYAQLRAQGVM